MEIGSFIELQFPSGMEYYNGDKTDGMNIVRLNTGRAAIFHAFAVTKCNLIWIPFYQCETVGAFLGRKGVVTRYYHIDANYNPIDLNPKAEEAVLLVNYFGIMSTERMVSLAGFYKNVIIDNSQAFFSKPISNCINVYSARKFIGVPDGSYVIGKDAALGIDKYNQGYSSDTSLFMLQRIEYGCEGKAYRSRIENEKRIDAEDCKKMSRLTRVILDGTDYEFIRKKRRENFDYANFLFEASNRLNPKQYYDDNCVPMVYPLLVEDEQLLNRLLEAKHFQGHWWSYLCSSMPTDSVEYHLSKYMIPITIDQRYGFKELDYIRECIYS